jgi:hypothetical protein
MDYCEWLKNAPFIRYVGPAVPWGECLSCYGTHLGVHHPIVPQGSTKNGPDPTDDWHVYAGIPYAHIGWAQICECVGDPLAAVGCLVDGKPVLGKVLLSARDRYTLDVYPHKFDCDVTCQDIQFASELTYADPSTLFLRCRITLPDDSAKSIQPVILGRQPGDIRSAGFAWPGNPLRIEREAIGGHDKAKHIFIRPSFDVENIGFSVEGMGDALLEALHHTPKDRFAWVRNTFAYAMVGKPIDPKGRTLEFYVAIGVSLDKNEAQACLDKAIDDPDSVEPAARAWFNDYFAQAEPPTKELTELEKKYYYGSIWVSRHNEFRPLGRFTRPHWLHSRGAFGGWGSSYFAADAGYMTIQLRDIDTDLAKQPILQLLDYQFEDGRVVNMDSASLRVPQAGSILMTLASLFVYDRDGDIEFLKTIYEPLKKVNQWWFNCRDINRNGIVESNDSGESGHDNNIVFMDICGPVEDVNCNSLLNVDLRCLAWIAEKLGRGNEAAPLRAHAEEHAKKMLATFYDEPSGLFFNRLADGELITIKSLHSCFFPMFAKIVDADLARKTIREHLMNENEFFTPAPFPDVARDEYFYSQGRHTGTTWMHLNLLMLVGMTNYGFKHEAEEVRRRIINYISRSNSFWQYFDPEGGGFCFTNMGRNHRWPNVSWAAAAYQAIVLRRYEDLAGIIDRVSGFAPKQNG